MDIDLAVLRGIERERDISLDVLIPAIEQALLLAYQRTDGAYRSARAELDRKVPGIAEALRASGLSANSLDAGLSRGVACISGSTVIVNLAGSRGAIRDGMATLGPLVRHVIADMNR